MNKLAKCFLITFIIIILILVIVSVTYYFIPKKIYSASDFEIEVIKSSYDYDNDGTDDYTDIMLGARKDAIKHPRYDSSYVIGGYPKDDVGVCADTIWRAFKNAGYSLKDMIDLDTLNHPSDYFSNGEKRDTNIDFRRVRNLKVFFDKYAYSLTLNPKKIEAWQPGDIVIFGNSNHIGIISDKRNKNGVPYLIHNAGQPKREEDALIKWANNKTITGHYRWDGGHYDNIW